MDREKILTECREAYEHGYNHDEENKMTSGVVAVLMDVIEELENRVANLEDKDD